MKKDIELRKVENIAIAICPEADSDPLDPELLWEVYFINLKEEAIKNLLITSQGYDRVENEVIKSSTFRDFYEEIPPLELTKVELIPPALFNIANEYFVSFSLDGYLYDKKFVFVKGSICPENFVRIPFLGRSGVMIN